ncbi:hypothetical protein EUGRSUZ_B01638 [Eucalyptus grandis]|uniref:Uncharacterized protein n=2 Tax=Eucalyptus grandis TaxID=71139 RepID=A0ACC3LRB5_EUCGR|nr:hypothetical protein EUGRSUZ_B01638 [Eucalyptus grandis]
MKTWLNRWSSVGVGVDWRAGVELRARHRGRLKMEAARGRCFAGQTRLSRWQCTGSQRSRLILLKISLDGKSRRLVSRWIYWPKMEKWKPAQSRTAGRGWREDGVRWSLRELQFYGDC